ncbi:MAG: avidin/streptavidin family protein [Acidobacteriota bacterium]
MRRSMMAFTLALSLAPAVPADDCRLPDIRTWTNGVGSLATIEVSEAGELSGTYRTAVGCRAGELQPLTGWCNGYGVTFAVDFRGCGSTTAWAGTIVEDDDGPRIEALWHLVRAGDAPAWDAVIAGKSTFRPAPETLDETEAPAGSETP